MTYGNWLSSEKSFTYVTIAFSTPHVETRSRHTATVPRPGFEPGTSGMVDQSVTTRPPHHPRNYDDDDDDNDDDDDEEEEEEEEDYDDDDNDDYDNDDANNCTLFYPK
ncbi:hypothetical protein DPMN_078705 [Dreissena polymorpha]|uniref:Uncharacterized protein n=1 Tax=Dreissena polymorpha TaxID=45954 RepID=A0A9D3YMR0_DREPO|nr:hypothetical protein DPMN_078705 [Dreissena polymorpha]